MRVRSNNAGFTLVEVLIAVAILASLTALMWASIANMFSTRDAIEKRTDRYHQVRVTMNRMAKEIASAYVAGPEFGGEEIPGEETFGVGADGEQSEEEAMMAAQGQEPSQFGMIGRDDELHFTGFSHVRTMPREKASQHAEIGYFIRSERNEEGDLVDMLMRREDVSADDDLTKGGVIYKMLPEVESIEFEFWDPGKVELGTFEEIAQGRWVKEWDTTRREYGGRLPTRVKIRLTLPAQGPNSEPEVFVTQTLIHTTEVLEY
jgi:prepilin-type N-terminal cleavage/methylation domain-containing protein